MKEKKPTGRKPAKKNRLPLNLDRVLGTAIALADKDGLAALSMRKLGQELKVEAMSLYNYVDSKEALLDAIIDRVIAETAISGEQTDWKEVLRERAKTMRAVFHRHPWAMGLLESRTTAVPSAVNNIEAVAGSLRRAGFPPGLILQTVSATDCYIYGFALQETSSPFKSNEEIKAVVEHFSHELSREQFPYLSEILVDYVLKEGVDFDRSFEKGLEFMLTGLEKALKEQPRKKG